MLNKNQKGLPFETKNKQNHENRRLVLIESLHMQHYSAYELTVHAPGLSLCIAGGQDLGLPSTKVKGFSCLVHYM